MEQLDLFTLMHESEVEQSKAATADYPDIMTITEDNPLRNEAVFWATDYTWHMAVHECEGLLASRKQYREENPQSRYIKPVIYCNAWQARGEDPQSWNIAEIGHSSITACPHCGADLSSGKGTVIIERRFKDKPYQCVYERPLPHISVIESVADAIAEQLTPEEIQEVLHGEAEIVIDNELRCHKCNEMPEFEPHENTLNGQTWFAVFCKCRSLPKDGFLFGNMEDALEGWRDANQKNIPTETQDPLCPICREPPRFEPCEMASGTIWYHIACKCGSFPRKISNLYGTKESATEHWLDPIKREIIW